MAWDNFQHSFAAGLVDHSGRSGHFPRFGSPKLAFPLGLHLRHKQRRNAVRQDVAGRRGGYDHEHVR